MSTLDKVIEKIRKLRALSKSSNVNEATAAAAAAQRLMSQHQLEAAAVNVNRDAVEDHACGDETRMDAVTWEVLLLSVLCELNSCDCLMQGLRNEVTLVQRELAPGIVMGWPGSVQICQPRVVGRGEYVRTVKYLHELYVAEIKRLLAAAPEGTEAASFCIGAAAKLADRLRKAHAAAKRRFRRKDAESAERAIVRLDQAKADADTFSREKYKSRPIALNGSYRDVGSFDAGNRAADAVELGAQSRSIPGEPLRIGGGK